VTGGWDRHEWIAAAGTRMHAAVRGEPGRPSVVCVHGQGCSHRYFLPFARALSRRAEVVAPDLPGFGWTRGPRQALDVRGLSEALASWLRATGGGGSVLVANSAGCQIVVDLAVDSPDLLGPVVLNGPTVDPSARTWGRQAGRWILDGPLENPGLPLVLARDYLDCGPRRFAKTFSHILHDPVERKLGHVITPAVVVRGAWDPLVPAAWAGRVAAELPRGRLVEVPLSGHTLNWSRPRALAKIVAPLLPRTG
jgi:pimeloyl-ACP methyl ester carboxylesterase